MSPPQAGLGTTAGVRAERALGVVWLDAHADFDTPEDNLSGFTDVMGLSVLTGGCWQALRATIPGFRPVGEDHVVLGGTRALKDYQQERLAASGLTVVGRAVDPGELLGSLTDLHQRVERVYLHVDLDVLDTSEGQANLNAAAGGLDLGTVVMAINETSTDSRCRPPCSRPTIRESTTTEVAAAARTIAQRIAWLPARNTVTGDTLTTCPGERTNAGER